MDDSVATGLRQWCTDMYTLRKNIRNIQELLDAGKADEARRSVERRLAQLPEDSLREKRALFDILLYIEVSTDNPRNALNVIERWSAIGFRTFSQRFSNSVLAGRLLMEIGQCFAARARLTELLTDPRSKKQEMLLDALTVYVESDERCREEMDVVLRTHCAATVKALGIPSRSVDKHEDVNLLIRRSNCALRASSREYQKLVVRLLNENTDSRAEIVQDIRARLRKEKVGFFREQLRRMLNNIESKHTPDGKTD